MTRDLQGFELDNKCMLIALKQANRFGSPSTLQEIWNEEMEFTL